MIFDLYQQGNWSELEYREDLPHTFAVGAYYQAPANDLYLYKLSANLAENEAFSGIVCNLNEYLDEGLRVLTSWTPDTFLSNGQRIENLKKMLTQ